MAANEAFLPPEPEGSDSSSRGGRQQITLAWDDPKFDPGAVGYWGFGLGIAYAWDSGLRVAPRAAPARTRVAVWRATSEVSYKIITCAACRVDAAPSMPHVDTGDPNDVLLSREVSLPSNEYFVDGGTMIVVVQRLVYANQMAHTLTQPLTIPNDVLRVNVPKQLNPAQFSRLLVGQPCPPGDFTGGRIAY